VANARRERIIQSDIFHKTQRLNSQSIKPNVVKVDSILNRARAVMDEREDDCKTMNAMMLYSRVATIRDKQLEENKRLESEYLDGQKRLDIMMEIERLKDLREQRSREERRVVATYKGAEKIIEQIKDRDLERLKQEEIRQLERAQLAKNI
jgi:hypothetical protein